VNETYTTVVGNLATRVDLRSVPDGTMVASFRVASNERRRDRATGSWRDGDTLYVNVTCWRALAENVHASFGVGDPVVVHGRLFTRSWEKDGRRQSDVEMEGYAAGPDLARSRALVTRTNRSEASGAGATVPEPPAASPDREMVDADPSSPGATGGGRQEEQPAVHDTGGRTTPPDGVRAAMPAPAEAGVGL
jgi:single-strand DNA-binding protein